MRLRLHAANPASLRARRLRPEDHEEASSVPVSILVPVLVVVVVAVVAKVVNALHNGDEAWHHLVVGGSVQ